MTKKKQSWIARFLRHPVTAISAGVLSVFSGLKGLGAIASVIGATAGLWFPLLGVIHTLGGILSIIPGSVTTPLFIGGALLYAAYLSESLWDRITKKLKNLKS